MGNYLKFLREKRDWTQLEAAVQFGMSESGYRKIERSERGLEEDAIRKAMEIYEVSASIVLDGPQTVPVVGYVGAGAEAHFYSMADNPNEEAPMPEDGNAKTVAVEVRGNSLGPLFNNSIVYYDDVRTPPDDTFLRRLCVVGLPDGRVLVKRLIPGRRRGLYHLESQTEGIIEDVEVEWAALVKHISPR